MQALADRAVDELHGTHFDIPEQIRRIECCLAPTGAAASTTRAPRTSPAPAASGGPPRGSTTSPTWGEVTTAYHEGVPGHHLQIGQAAVRDELHRYQRLLLGFISGYGEGWALYSERLMGELGYLEDPGDYYMGYICSPRRRSAPYV